MSPPTRQFGKLSINTQMPTTRRQAQERSSGKAQDPESTSSSSGEDGSNDEQAARPTRSLTKSQTSQSKGKQPARSESEASSTDTSRSPIMSRAYKTRDILSTFDEDVLPNDYRPDIFERIDHPRRPEQCVRQLDLEGTIFQLAVNDHAVYKSLSKAQPVKARAVGFFQKVRKQIRGTLEAFDRYAVTGAPPEAYLGAHPSVKELGVRLQNFVNIIKDGVPERHPHGADRAAECLIYLLREVCNRNNDAFENATWRRRVPHGEDEDDRNLFQCLIGHVSTSTPLFALDALKTLPPDELAAGNKREQLDEIRGLLHRYQAPVAYRHALQMILDPLAGASSPATGPQPGQKRPAAGTGRGGQKRTK
jgi:hypothetical protein